MGRSTKTYVLMPGCTHSISVMFTRDDGVEVARAQRIEGGTEVKLTRSQYLAFRDKFQTPAEYTARKAAAEAAAAADREARDADRDTRKASKAKASASEKPKVAPKSKKGA